MTQKKKFKLDYDVCPCWISPCDPDESRGSCECCDMGECRYPHEKEKWVKCKHLLKGCEACPNVGCEHHKDYERFKNCYIAGCKDEVVIVTNINGVETPMCNKHFELHFETEKKKTNR